MCATSTHALGIQHQHNHTACVPAYSYYLTTPPLSHYLSYYYTYKQLLLLPPHIRTHQMDMKTMGSFYYENFVSNHAYYLSFVLFFRTSSDSFLSSFRWFVFILFLCAILFGMCAFFCSFSPILFLFFLLVPDKYKRKLCRCKHTRKSINNKQSCIEHVEDWCLGCVLSNVRARNRHSFPLSFCARSLKSSLFSPNYLSLSL